MSTRFDVDFSEALRQLAEFQLRMSNMGHALDKMEQKSGKPATAAKRLMKDVNDQFDKLEHRLKSAGAETEKLGQVTQSARMSVSGMMSKIAADNLKLTVQTQAWSGALSEVERLLADSSAKSSFVKWAERTRALGAELTNQNKYLAASLKALETAEGRHNEVLKASLAVKRQVLTSDVRQQGEILKLQLAEQNLSTELGKTTAKRKAKLKVDAQEVTEATRLVGTLGQARRAYEGLNGGLQAQIAVQQAMNQGLAASATFRQREQNLVEELRRRHESLNGGLAEQAAQLRVLNSAREKEITELTRERAKIEELTRALASLNGGEQEQIAKLNAKIAARRKAIQEDGHAVEVLERLSQSAARLIVAEQRHKASIEAVNRATLEEARALQQMTRAEAEALAKTEALTAANKRHSESLLDEARKAHGMSKAQQELSQAREREIERLGRLKAQKDLLNGAYGRELAAVQRQIQEQTRYNKLLTMTTAELMGFTSAQAKANATLQIGSQSAAMMRAALSGMHTNIGMYTSGTIIAASSTYALASSLRSAVEIGSEFTASMARSNAIMNGNQPFWMTDTGSMQAMEMQVRALGQSTVYTASEVAGGLTELGMAGLSAGDAVVALRPALDLATIGGISMAQSADIATNVMMTFGMEAKNLGEVVDVMATAVTSSNTNIEQLANALTYAGPAAQTAGISMRDTVAAVEALANSGIKASRSGTALRRLFVSILNPTAKGAEMLSKYGISVLDAEGKTRGLVDIVQQMSKALKDVPGGERLTAIQDLVGVYATSPIAALVDQADNLAELRKGLDDVSGAAVRMRDKISDGLKYDWKEVISSFEEVKLAAFDTVEMRLRTASASMSKFLIDLTLPIRDGESLTHLDLLLTKAENTAVALAQMVGGILAFKFASGNVAAAFATDSKALGERLSILSARAAATGASMQTMATHTAGSSVAMRVQAAAALGGAGALGTFSSSAAVAAGWMSKLAVGASALMRALGWVGLIYGIGSALYTVFGSDTEEAARAQKDGVDELKNSYDALKKSIMDVALAKERDALSAQITAENGSIEQATARKGRLPSLIEEGKRQGLPTGLLESELAGIDGQIAKYRENVENAKQALDRLKTTEADRLSLLEQQERQIVAARDAELAYKAELEKSVSSNSFVVNTSELERLKAAWEAAKQSVRETEVAAEGVSARMVSLGEIAAADLLEQQASSAAAAHEKQATAAEKLLSLQSRRAVVQAEINELVAADEAAIEAGSERPGQDTLNRLLEERAELMTKEVELYQSATDQANSLADAQQAISDFYLTDEQRLADLETRLENVVAQRAEYNLLRETSHSGLYDELETERLTLELQLLQQIQQLKQSIANENKPRRTGKTEEEKRSEKLKREAEQALQSARTSFAGLKKEFDPLGVSLDEISEKTKHLDLLMKKGEITAQQRAQALYVLGKAHRELAQSQDKNAQALERLREAYKGDSAVANHAKELSELNRLYVAGTVSMTEYLRLKQKISEASASAVLDGAPTVEVGSNREGDYFSDTLNTLLAAGQGAQFFDNRSDELTSGRHQGYRDINEAYTKEMEALAEKRATELLTEQQHQEALTELQARSNTERAALNQQFDDANRQLLDQRMQYEQQAGMAIMASIAGTASNIFGMFAAVGEEATAAQKAAFVAQKTLAVAQIILHTELAAVQAMAAPDVPLFSMKIPAAAAIRAVGYASAGLVGALAIGQLAGGGSGGGSSYAGAYDKGGQIPYGKWGIVGEYGPEIVEGPAHVTGREATARKSGGSGDYNITLAPQVTVQYSGSSGGAASDADARALANSVSSAVTTSLKEQMRPGGVLDAWMRNQKRS